MHGCRLKGKYFDPHVVPQHINASNVDIGGSLETSKTWKASTSIPTKFYVHESGKMRMVQLEGMIDFFGAVPRKNRF